MCITPLRAVSRNWVSLPVEIPMGEGLLWTHDSGTPRQQLVLCFPLPIGLSILPSQSHARLILPVSCRDPDLAQTGLGLKGLCWLESLTVVGGSQVFDCNMGMSLSPTPPSHQCPQAVPGRPSSPCCGAGEHLPLREAHTALQLSAQSGENYLGCGPYPDTPAEGQPFLPRALRAWHLSD